MWTYIQVNGQLLDDDGTVVDTGYSGCDEGKNNPSMQAVHDMGPIPQGRWTIFGPPFNTPDHGPNVLRLEPVNGTNTFGRDGFLMHGDNKDFPGTASKGCIIMGPSTRPRVWASGDHDLNVVAAPEAPGDDETAA
ncbi:MAG TPA: tlde1 domain-containing protein [Candidatus Solibacter sp.]|nr:tlde1 domain-containing protein [Candidatus Solibacter sp.]